MCFSHYSFYNNIIKFVFFFLALYIIEVSQVKYQENAEIFLTDTYASILFFSPCFHYTFYDFRFFTLFLAQNCVS